MQVFLYNVCHVLSDFNTKQLVQFNYQYTFLNFLKRKTFYLIFLFAG